VNRETREDVSAYEARRDKSDVKWNPPWRNEAAPVIIESDEHADKDESTKTYA
jgi:hypothetical protein